MKNNLQLFALSCLIISSAVAIDDNLHLSEINKEENLTPVKVIIPATAPENANSNKNIESKKSSSDNQENSSTKSNTVSTTTVSSTNSEKVENSENKDLNIEKNNDTIATESKISRMMNTVAGAVSLQFAWNYLFSKTGTTDWVAKSVYNFAEDSRFVKLNDVSRAHVIYTLTAAGVLYGAYKVVRNYYENSVEEDIFATNN